MLSSNLLPCDIKLLISDIRVSTVHLVESEEIKRILRHFFIASRDYYVYNDSCGKY